VDWLIENWKYVTLAMALASVVVNFTPNETDNKYYAMVLTFVKAIAGNFNVTGIVNK
jgi:hypothetical protein